MAAEKGKTLFSNLKKRELSIPSSPLTLARSQRQSFSFHSAKLHLIVFARFYLFFFCFFGDARISRKRFMCAQNSEMICILRYWKCDSFAYISPQPNARHLKNDKFIELTSNGDVEKKNWSKDAIGQWVSRMFAFLFRLIRSTIELMRTDHNNYSTKWSNGQNWKTRQVYEVYFSYSDDWLLRSALPNQFPSLPIALFLLLLTLLLIFSCGTFFVS